MLRKIAVAAGVAAAVIGAALTFNSASAQFRREGGGGNFSGGGHFAAHGFGGGHFAAHGFGGGSGFAARGFGGHSFAPSHLNFGGSGFAARGFGGHSFAPSRLNFGGRSFAPHAFAGHSFAGSRLNFGRFGGVARGPMGGFGLAHNAGRFGHNFTPLHGATTFAPDSAWRGDRSWGQHRGSWGEHRGWFARQGFHRGYVGWAGPVFWPYAYDDLFDYAFEPYYDGYDGDLFWAYGYDDLFAGVLLPYAAVGRGYGVGAAPVPNAATTASSSGQACVSAQSLSGGASIDAISNAVHPTADQSAKLGALKTAEESAEKSLAASCATRTPATAEGRLDAVDARLQAMAQASDAVRGPLNDFYSSLSDEQKAAFNALGQDRSASAPKATQAALGSPPVLAQLCGPENAVPVVATDQIDKAVQPDAKQQQSLAALSDAANKADQAILASCPSQAPMTPTGRLDAVRGRLQAMLNGVALVKPALHDFYASLSDEQKARFDALTQPPSPANSTASHG